MCKSFSIISLFFMFFFKTPALPGTTSEPKNQPASIQKQETDSDENKDSKETGHEDSFIPRIDQLFNNPAVISGLQTTANAINRSVESLMDSIFYSLIDNQLRHPVSNELYFGINTRRDVYNTTKGSYVVVDRFFMGPESRKKIGQINTIPIWLGSYTHTDMLNIYLRTDAQRLSEKESLPFWRYWLNNWFGGLPLLGALLPPSFNPNEMYDPLTLLETPFKFPTDPETFREMPIGSIRSYGVSGGISLPFDLSQIRDKHKAFLDKFDLKSELPYSIFIQGEFRINVLRKNKNEAWVGLSKLRKSGNSLNAFVGNSFYLLAGAIKGLPWKGFPTVLAPVDLQWILSDILQTDQLYSFNMTQPQAVDAWKDAVKGQFSKAWQMAQNAKSPHVQWHFSRTRKALEEDFNRINSYFFLRNERKLKTTQAEIEINDPKGRYYILENTGTYNDSKNDLLLGSEEISVHLAAEMNVNRHDVKPPEKDKEKSNQKTSPKVYYTFKKESPYYLNMRLNISDRETTVEEYNQYIHLLKTFSQLPLKDIPDFPLRSDQGQKAYRKRAFYFRPDDLQSVIHVPVTTLGKFNANASVYLSTSMLRTIWSKPPKQYQEDFKMLFGLSADKRPDISGETLMQKLRRHVTSPLNIFQLYFPHIDAYREFETITNQFALIHPQISPEELSKIFSELFTTSYPERIVGFLIRQGQIASIPRKVTFYVSPSKSLDSEQKQKIQNLNERTFQSTASFPALQRYQIAREKLNVFFPTNLKDDREKPTISHISIDTVKSERPEPDIQIGVKTKNLHFMKPSLIYVRLETTGKVQLGNYLIGQDVIKLKPDQSQIPDIKDNEQHLTFFLTGQKSPLSGFLFDQLFALGGEFLLSISVSADGQVWSGEKSFRFQFSDGQLLPPGFDNS